ncbi:serine/threonine-protein kinase VRK1 isoform X2 [Nilaparvata lugens]|uniref:serine/threonine-protein kinase VRK1 isoform X2 n=1 Tax=Nilaparvata lugens TaxID=108931 RepID=UPI00193E9215|nr:serine/threonine-protein kinase VRK1 isoform X2 [Nilaparvata lugens]XP_022188226.2 serine/threonine-protein kinase VRK1 isoform X1 [Nilaparvata lugens]XP_039280451.1 serine/threonine-protein kinase VRK1 isoform X3 [Nilaparvata lugens]XP_039280452.1 serine/threonine-protein kinase VRK1 isoform X2 [Nilaparvata lugens]
MPRNNVSEHKKRSAPNGYKLPFRIREGEIFTDLRSKQWRLGKSIGYGGFGEIYLASDEITKPVPSDAKYVIKVEPHSNGPLLIERIFYMRVAKLENIDSWVAKNDMSALGMPYFVGAGSHMYRGEHYRFLIIPRFGLDLHKVFVEKGKKFHIKTALTIASYVIDILEYLHSHNYVHADIKPDNLLLGLAAQAPVYLVDFGLACRYRYPNGRHKEFCVDERKAHYGTIQYTSRDAHIGAISRRGDLEILGYNVIYLLTGHLPWEDDVNDEELVAEKKKYAMNNINEFLASCFMPESPPDVLVDYLDYVNKLNFDSRPNFKYCKRLFRKGIQDAGYCDDGKLTFEAHAKLKAKKRKSNSESENMGVKKVKKSLTFGLEFEVPNRKPCTAQNFNRMTRKSSTSQSNVKPLEDFDWAMVLAGNPEKCARKNSQSNKSNQSYRCDNDCSLNYSDNYTVDPVDDSMNNPTPAMLEVIARRKQRAQTITAHRRSKSESRCSSPTELMSSGLTPAMEAVIRRRQALAAAAAAANEEAKTTAAAKVRKTRSSSRKCPAIKELKMQFKAMVLQPCAVSKRASTSPPKRVTRLNCANA